MKKLKKCLMAHNNKIIIFIIRRHLYILSILCQYFNVGFKKRVVLIFLSFCDNKRSNSSDSQNRCTNRDFSFIHHI